MTSDESQEPEEYQDDENEDGEDPVNREDVLFEGEELGYDAPEWLRCLVGKREELIAECERLGVDPHEVLTSCEEINNPFEYVEFLGADVESGSYGGAGPGGGGWHRVVRLEKSLVPAAIERGEEELREGVRRLRLLYLRSKGFADLETRALEAIVGKLGPLNEAARSTERREVVTLRQELKWAQMRIEGLEKALGEAKDARLEATTAAGSDDLRVSRETWRNLGLWPIGPLAWLSDGSVAYLHNFLDGCISQHDFWYGVVDKLHAAGVKIRGIDCKNSRVLARSPMSGISYGYRVNLAEKAGAGPTWNDAWRFALREGACTQLILPPELSWLRDRLRDQLGITATLTTKD